MQVESGASLVCELAPGFFTWTQFAELEPGLRQQIQLAPSASAAVVMEDQQPRYSFSTTQADLTFRSLFAFCSGVYVTERSGNGSVTGGGGVSPLGYVLLGCGLWRIVW